MKVGDLVQYKVDNLSTAFFNTRMAIRNSDKKESVRQVSIGIIVGFEINYDRFGDPIERVAVVNWGSIISEETDYMELLEVINE